MQQDSTTHLLRGASLNLERGTQPQHTPETSSAYQVGIAVKDYGNGELKLLAVLYPEGRPRIRVRGQKATGSRDTANVEHMLRASRRAKTEVHDRCMMIRANRMGTLAIRQGNGWHPTTEQLSQVMHQFHHMAETVPDANGKTWPIGPCVFVFEHTNKDGEPFTHSHVAYRSEGFENWQHWYHLVNLAVTQVILDYTGPETLHATFNVQHKKSANIPRARIAYYMTKYLTKDLTAGDLNKRRFGAINALKPDTQRITLPRSLFGLDLAQDLASLLGAMTGRTVSGAWHGITAGYTLIAMDTLQWQRPGAGDAPAGGTPAPQPHPGTSSTVWQALTQWAAAQNLRHPPSSPDDPPPDAGCTCWMCRKAHPRKTSGPPRRP